uniref:Chemokine interleukin-8-like domain-containing protein n=1 Tax=Capra hircus TaxID=9925 RepID=A0A8C2XZ06_CAPHI
MLEGSGGEQNLNFRDTASAEAVGIKKTRDGAEIGWSLIEEINCSTACCSTLTNKKIPIQKLETYQRITSSQCPWEAVM